jgi:hypothetical protein
LGDFGKHEIARGVTETVVDALEVVNIEEDHAERVLVTPSEVLLAVEMFLEVTAVEEACERIGATHPFEFVVSFSELVLESLDMTSGTHPRDEFGGFEGLLEIVVSASAQAGENVIHPGADGKEYDRDIF